MRTVIAIATRGFNKPQPTPAERQRQREIENGKKYCSQFNLTVERESGAVQAE